MSEALIKSAAQAPHNATTLGQGQFLKKTRLVIRLESRCRLTDRA